MKTHALKIETTPIDALIPYARNARTHSDEQVAQIAASMREFGWTNPILVDDDGGIIAGHGRLAAARKLGMDTVPTIRLDGLTKAQRKALVIADNKLAMNAGWDSEMLKLELSELQAMDFDISLTGFDASYLDPIDLDASSRIGDLVFSVVVECDSEDHQARTLARLEGEGMRCRALMS